MDLKTAKTYVYVDASNIRYACLRSCNFSLDFIKLYSYFQKKYHGLQEIRYYEGIALDDTKKRKHFNFLQKKIGYKVCPLERKSYVEVPKFAEFICKKCGSLNSVQIMPTITKMKSNVDVYLTSDMLECVAQSNEPLHIIIVSCDGDYAEAIKSALRLSPQSCVTILATPMTKKNNCLSVRLKQLSKQVDRKNFKLANINNLKDEISQKSEK